MYFYQGLPGSGLNQFIEQFKEAFIADPFHTLLIVPTARLARHISDLLTADGVISCLNTGSITTLKGFLEEFHVRTRDSRLLLSTRDTQLILNKLLKEHQSTFKILSNQVITVTASIESALLLFLNSVYSYNLDSDSYPACLGELAGAKSAELGRFKEIYEKYLAENGLIDSWSLVR
ncbi:MAG: hypothetical protein ACTSRU_19735, partial [Candidatus Hodarchaeales archaeon]